MDFKKTAASPTTITRNVEDLEAITGNIYETLAILSKRSNQISAAIKDELSKKLEDFATFTDNLEEVFENREQIEISKFYERLPKGSLIAIEEILNEEIYYRIASDDAGTEK